MYNMLFKYRFAAQGGYRVGVVWVRSLVAEF